nr:hypothetical protein [Tsukamurella sp. PLM1]
MQTGPGGTTITIPGFGQFTIPGAGGQGGGPVQTPAPTPDN